MRIAILFFVLLFSIHRVYSHPLGTALGYGLLVIAGDSDLRREVLDAVGVLSWLEEEGIYLDEDTGELFYNDPDADVKSCYYWGNSHKMGYLPHKRFDNAVKLCEFFGPSLDERYDEKKEDFTLDLSQMKDALIPRMDSPWPSWTCYWTDRKTGKNKWGASYTTVCPSLDDCKRMNKERLEKMDVEKYHFDESDLGFWEGILSNDEMADLVRHLGKKKKGKKKRKRSKYESDDDDQSSCGLYFKKHSKKRPKWDCDDCEDGEDGQDGEDGERGEKGEKGDDGDRGDKGKKGDKGDKGKDGKDGKDKENDSKKKDDDCSICALRKDLKKYEEERKAWREKPLRLDEPKLPQVVKEDFTERRDINVGFSQCPADRVINIHMVGIITISFNWFCRFAEIIRYFVLASASIYSAYILLGVSRRG